MVFINEHRNSMSALVASNYQLYLLLLTQCLFQNAYLGYLLILLKEFLKIFDCVLSGFKIDYYIPCTFNVLIPLLTNKRV